MESPTLPSSDVEVLIKNIPELRAEEIWWHVSKLLVEDERHRCYPAWSPSCVGRFARESPFRLKLMSGRGVGSVSASSSCLRAAGRAHTLQPSPPGFLLFSSLCMDLGKSLGMIFSATRCTSLAHRHFKAENTSASLTEAGRTWRRHDRRAPYSCRIPGN